MKSKTNIVEEPIADYKKAEDDLMRKALSSSYIERFYTMARLMKMNIMLKSAKVIHKKMD
ncbi:hypothetical protein [Pedobacter cryotolerans]|uniref:Uncharacterized protein n=1 Tax=Pedobacter cryotolerans TaxID=2571270 RepID=A0A4U1C9T5_9SPHI|nr:hypothetical protein [Pedobacter cryotolerans]TKC02545.1 hypothetical protein FA045_04525 [Pedobacter cryotolerans]